MEYKNVYFLGIGGIGMSALARYFLHGGYAVAGYDRTPSHLTGELEAEGAAVHYEDDVRLIPEGFLDPKKTMVVYTPAVPQDHGEYRYFREHGFCVEKRSQMLGHLAEGKYVMAVAGTHGKTTTSSMLASALDRSFLRLYPDVAVVTSADADHLDIYGTHEAVKEAFSQFVRQIRPGGSLIIKRGVDIVIDNPGIAVYRYSYDEPCDFYARNVQLLEGGHYRYDLVTPSGAFEGCTLGVPGWVNIENAVAAVASVWCAAKAGGTPLDADKLRGALASFSGVKRRFEFYVNTPKQVYMDDYAHHPRELAATLTSVRKMFPGRRITALFQPHLYTRTRDLHAEFAEALSHADEVVLLPIYPAREEPIPGITSEIIARRVAAPCRIVDRDHLADEVAAMDTDVVISFGAGNIDACCPALAERLKMTS